MSLVSFVKIRGNTTNSVKESILKSLDLIDYSLEKKIANIVIKPNLCYYWDYSTGQTTDPKFVAALIDLIHEKVSSNVNISIVESDASAMKCKYAFKMLGYEQLSQLHNVRLVNLSEDQNNVANFTVGKQSFRLMVPNVIRNADLKINVPKIKYTVEKLKITCALKNVFGCNPYPKKFKYHQRIDEAIVALNKAMNFDLCLVDGTVVSGAQPRKLGLLMASRDSVAIDAAAARIAGINPNKITYLKLASKEGLGEMVFSPRGMSINYFTSRYPHKSIRTELMSTINRLLAYTGINEKIGL
jgi:uncharacterized protein (DUF362 family)